MPIPGEDISGDYAARLRDAILDNSALRNGLNDDEAQPLIDRGLSMADRVTVGVQDEARYEQLY